MDYKAMLAIVIDAPDTS